MSSDLTTPEAVVQYWEESYDDRYVQYLKSRPILLGVIILTILIIGLIGNGLVILCGVLHPSRFNSAHSAFFINLCVASIVFLGFGIPLILYENVFMHNWTLGESFCKFHRYVQYCCFYGLAYAQVLIVLFQFLNLVMPHRITKINTACIGAVICIIKWTVILLANIPNWTGHGLYNEMEGILFCYNKDVHNDIDRLKTYTLLHFTFSFAFPFTLMCFVSLLLLAHLICRVSPRHYTDIHQGALLHKRTASLTVLLTILFAVCWTPDKVFALLLTFKPLVIGLNVIVISDVFLCLACLNTCLNPWCIYLIVVRVDSGRYPASNRCYYPQQGTVGHCVARRRGTRRDDEDSKVEFSTGTEVVVISHIENGHAGRNNAAQHARDSENVY